MKVYKQVRPFNPHDILNLRVWKKRVYPRGYHAQIQVGQRAWLLMPTDKTGPPKRARK